MRNVDGFSYDSCYPQDLRESRGYPSASSTGDMGSRIPSYPGHPGSPVHVALHRVLPTSNLRFLLLT